MLESKQLNNVTTDVQEFHTIKQNAAVYKEHKDPKLVNYLANKVSDQLLKENLEFIPQLDLGFPTPS